jgi:hypothetical protein
VDVTVNVGGPTFVDATGRRVRIVPVGSPAAPSEQTALTGLAAGLKIGAEAARRLAASGTREEAERKLALCDSLVYEIEKTIALDLLPPGSLIKERYHQGLEARSRGARGLDQPKKEINLAAVHADLDLGVRLLAHVRESLAARD